jgi:glucose/arabinose dehydrogenase
VRGALLFVGLLAACSKSSKASKAPSCTTYTEQGPTGTPAPTVSTVVSGLEVPWSVAFLPNGDAWISERPGRIRPLRGGTLGAPVATLPVAAESEGGLLGLALDPGFRENRRFFVYFTGKTEGRTENRVERWIASEDLASARLDRAIVEGISAAKYHDGGRIRVGPDGMLWIGTGDARAPELSQDRASPNGKVLRVTLDGAAAPDNPWPGNRAVLTGLRNLQAFDFLDARTLVLADHGPSGDLGRRGHDEVSIATFGANLGWPAIYGCEARDGMLTPQVVFEDAVPPGGGAIVRGDALAAWKGNFVVATLASKSLHRFVLDGARITGHDVHLRDAFGRLREVANAPDGSLWVTTSNCDGRGACGPEKDRILRLTL